jgi:hypothetical protein
MIDALGPARLSARSCGCGVSCIGPPALLPSPPSPSRARAMHRATGRLTVSDKGFVICCWLRRPRRSQRAPRRPTNILRPRQSSGAQRTWRFAVNPERPNGVRGQNRNLSLISVAERNQHRHSMTPGRLAAVKDRGCPPILTCCGFRLASKNRLPPRPLLAAAARARRRP